MLTPEIQFQLEAIFRLLLAGILGAVVGYEREAHHRPAGLRTYILVSVGACLFTLVSIVGFPGSDSARVAAQIVTGIGFIGAGTIIRARAGVRGVTTAAGIWAIAAVGMAAGSGVYLLAVATALGAYAVLQYLRVRVDAKEPNETDDVRASDEAADEAAGEATGERRTSVTDDEHSAGADEPGPPEPSEAEPPPEPSHAESPPWREPPLWREPAPWREPPEAGPTPWQEPPEAPEPEPARPLYPAPQELGPDEWYSQSPGAPHRPSGPSSSPTIQPPTDAAGWLTVVGLVVALASLLLPWVSGGFVIGGPSLPRGYVESWGLAAASNWLTGILLLGALALVLLGTPPDFLRHGVVPLAVGLFGLGNVWPYVSYVGMGWVAMGVWIMFLGCAATVAGAAVRLAPRLRPLA